MRRLLFSLVIVLQLAFLLIACDDAVDHAAKYLERGKTYYEQGDYLSARDEFNNTLRINPKSAEAHYYLGQVAKAKNEFTKASSRYRRALQEDPNFVPAMSELGQLYLLSNRVAKAEEIVHAIYKVAPQNPSGLLLEANIHLGRRELDQAIKKSRAALTADPSLISATTTLAFALHYKGQIDGAIAALDTAIARAHKKRTFYRIKIQILEESQRFDEAEAVHRELIASAPEALGPRIKLAQFYTRQGQLNEAETLLVETVNKFPNSGKARFQILYFLTNVRADRHAEALLRELVSRYPNTYDYQFSLATLYEKFGLDECAKAAYEKIILQAGEDPVALRAKTLLAGVYLLQDEMANTINLIDDVLREDPTNQDALLISAAVSLEQGEYLDVVTDLRVLLNSDPTSHQGLRMLADAHRYLGEEELAVETLRNLLDFHPTSVEGRAELASVLIHQGKIDTAKSLIEEAGTLDPDNPLVTQAKIELLKAQRRWDEAELMARDLADKEGAELSRDLLPADGLRRQCP
jgi:tetratricopeptide (TPR) repeat protein